MKKLILSIITGCLGIFNVVLGTSLEDLAARIEVLEKQMKELQRYKISEGEQFLSKNNRKLFENSNQALLEELSEKIYKDEEKNLFPWYNLNKWEQISLGMTPEDVLKFLGKPTKIEESLHKRIDFVYIYKGFRVPSKEEVEGFIWFYKNQAIEVQTPLF